MRFLFIFVAGMSVAYLVHPGMAAGQQKQQIPHNQSQPPGPALSPEEAVAKMQVPEGFTVEIVASEPDIVNPIGMTFDERGRVWITESVEYPRMSAGPGRDRIKVLEDTNHDGRMDKVTVFADGLNIPSGIAVGYGGVWVANAPDILFLQDTNGDGRADRQTVVVTGFGRDDTHELPNSLTWGPDGWLYGLNGVFNRSSVKDPVSGRIIDFTCALFRINPRTHEFQLFAEGTSNPWGVAWNPAGDAFLSACVIDHLWHLSETGYYHRQGGPYPAFTWKIESIVSHKHQKAAYCGIHYFDSDAYPAEYRDRLMMGNIHGNCINVDVLHDNESTYRAAPAEDFLTANDVWFMPVVQKTGPDGCLWVLDWYDRYHCYQDARRDPDGIDRLKGRLYRVRYGDSPRAGAFDLSQETTDQLLQRLQSPNVFFRDLAQRVLAERNDPSAGAALQQMALNSNIPLKFRLHALWARIGASPLTDDFLLQLLNDAEADLRAWAVRAAGNQLAADAAANQMIHSLRRDPHPRVRLQVAVAAAKLERVPTIPTLIDVLVRAKDDPLVPRIVWQNLHPLLETRTDEFVAAVDQSQQPASEGRVPTSLLELLPRAADRILATAKPDTAAVTSLVKLLLRTAAAADPADRALQLLTQRIRSGELAGPALQEVRAALADGLVGTIQGSIGVASPEERMAMSALELTVTVGLPNGLNRSASLIQDPQQHEDVRTRLLNAVISSGNPGALELAIPLLQTPSPASLQRRVVQAVGRIGSAESTAAILASLPQLPDDVQPAAIEALSERVDSSMALLMAIAAKVLPPSVINANQARKMLSLKNAELSELLTTHWGTVRTERDPARSRLISEMRNTLRTSNGDAVAGQAVFKRVCAQCHKIYGEGAEIGPDITRNGRASFEQLLSNVFDPSLVIGASYQAVTVVTTDGRAISGLPAEDNERRIVLKIQGDKQEIIARTDIEEVVQSPLSLMPEGLEKQLQPQELADLFAFLMLDRLPQDPDAAWLPGARIQAEATVSPERFPALIEQILPGFATTKSGVDGVALIPDYHGRPAVRTHPVSRNEACVIAGQVTVPEAQKVWLRVSVAADERGDWQLAIRVNGVRRHQSIIGHKAGQVEWHDIEMDVSDMAGKSATIELHNRANDWNYEFGYWNAVELLTDTGLPGPQNPEGLSNADAENSAKTADSPR